MDKIILSDNDLQYLLKWRDEHKELVRESPDPMKSIEIICKDSGFTIKGIREGGRLRLYVNHKGLSLGSVQFELRPDGLWNKIKDRTHLPDKDGVQSALTVYGSLMALMVFGNSTTSYDRLIESSESVMSKLPHRNDTGKNTGSKKPVNERNKPKRPSVTYILRRDKSGISVVSKGFHASPKGVFSVRGHYRRYRSGKVIWISEFKKGTGNKKNKNYKVRAGDNKTYAE